MKRWYAAKVRERLERSIAEGIEARNIEAFLPLSSVCRLWSDRVKNIQVPLFSGYVFCRIDPGQRVQVLTVPGVHYFVSIGNAPAPVSDLEIESIQTLVRAHAPVSPREFLAEGERVRVLDGPLRGTEGVLLRNKDEDQLVVSINLLRRSVAVTIDRAIVGPIDDEKARGYQPWSPACAHENLMSVLRANP